MDKPRLNETPLPILAKIYCITLGLGLLFGLSNLLNIFSASVTLMGTPNAWIAWFDIGTSIAILVLDIWILFDLLNRKWRFLYVLYAFIGVRLIYMMVMITLDMSLGVQALGATLVPVAWAIYFNKSVKLRIAFPIRDVVPASTEPESSEIGDETPDERKDAEDAPALIEVSETEQPQTENTESQMKSAYVPEQTSFGKKLFCKNCGTECGPDDIKCPNCGKRVRFVRKIINYKVLFIITLCAFLCTAIGLSTACVLVYKQNAENIIKIESLDELSQNLQRTIDKKNNEITTLKDAGMDLLDEVAEYGEKADFLDNHIAFVVSNDGYAYHTYDCHFFKNSDTYWAYNIEAAQAKGYYPCKVCH